MIGVAVGRQMPLMLVLLVVVVVLLLVFGLQLVLQPRRLLLLLRVG